MRKILFKSIIWSMLMVAAGCTADNPYADYYNDGSNWNNGGGMFNNVGSSTTEGDIATFDIMMDQNAEESNTATQAYYPDAEDLLDNNTFSTQITIDMSNPVAKEEGGVKVIVNGGHVIADHGSQKGICYVVSGSTSNGS